MFVCVSSEGDIHDRGVGEFVVLSEPEISPRPWWKSELMRVLVCRYRRFR
jgi:hypothetical protein